MATTTKRGRELREELNTALAANNPNNYIGFDYQADLSLLCRRAARYAKMQEDACCYEWASGDKWDAKEAQLEKSITDLAVTIPGVVGVKFTGDPRGYCVRLMFECGIYNTWGGREDGWGIA